jgi:hypothetical protein
MFTTLFTQTPRRRIPPAKAHSVPLMLKGEATQLPEKRGVIFHLGNRDFLKLTRAELALGDYIFLSETEKISNLYYTVSHIYQIEKTPHIILTPSEISAEMQKIMNMARSNTKTAEKDKVLVRAFDENGGMYSVNSETMPNVDMQIIRANQTLVPKMRCWDLRDPDSIILNVFVETTQFTRGAHNKAEKLPNLPEAVEDGLLSERVLVEAIRGLTKLDISSLNLHTYKDMLEELQNKVKRLYKEQNNKQKLFQYLIKTLQHEYKVKRRDSRMQWLRAGMGVFLKKVKGLGGMFGLPAAQPAWELIITKIESKIKKHWQQQDRHTLKHGHSLDKIEAATYETLENGMAKMVYLYWEMMTLYQNLLTTSWEDIKEKPMLLQSALTDLINLRQIRRESKETLDMIQMFTEQMQHDTNSMSTWLENKEVEIATTLLEQL